MDIGELRALVAVAEAGTVTAAAERLHVSQPALSERIRRLERDVGATLFERDGRGMRLTPAGEAYLPHVRQALADLERGQEAVRTTDRTRPVLRVDVHDPALAVPRRLLRQLRSELPDTDVEVFGSGTPEQIARLRDGRIDLALCLNARAPDGVDQILWETEPLVAMLPAEHPLAVQDAVPIPRLAEDAHYLPRESFAPDWNALVRRLVGSSLRAVGIHGDTADAPFDLVAAEECITIGLASTTVPDGVVTRPLAPPAQCDWVLRLRQGWRDEIPWLAGALAGQGRPFGPPDFKRARRRKVR